MSFPVSSVPAGSGYEVAIYFQNIVPLFPGRRVTLQREVMPPAVGDDVGWSGWPAAIVAQKCYEIIEMIHERSPCRSGLNILRPFTMVSTIFLKR